MTCWLRPPLHPSPTFALQAAAGWLVGWLFNVPAPRKISYGRVLFDNYVVVVVAVAVGGDAGWLAGWLVGCSTSRHHARFLMDGFALTVALLFLLWVVVVMLYGWLVGWLFNVPVSRKIADGWVDSCVVVAGGDGAGLLVACLLACTQVYPGEGLLRQLCCYCWRGGGDGGGGGGGGCGGGGGSGMGVGWMVAYLTSQHHASVSKGRVCLDNCGWWWWWWW